eukprot:CAMPEP_0176183266 /NCGR_PEP_ID=MMETSP0121_2-20121125/196_1 /TAXON_ID=160619 /ORGANISM="Kryptoperidinium foliaceum, Strain CCMP 1326" /LENGTH=54 /DNA_ID=CAMNT_0017521575 /DNA_START=83 /DNA_END=247 /DNA_ORIENTATION=-
MLEADSPALFLTLFVNGLGTRATLALVRRHAGPGSMAEEASSENGGLNAPGRRR